VLNERSAVHEVADSRAANVPALRRMEISDELLDLSSGVVFGLQLGCCM